MKSVKILVFGLPGSGKSTLSNKLAQKLGATHLNADALREEYQDWDFSNAGRKRQLERFITLSDAATTQFVIMDFVCPLRQFRDRLKPDIMIFMDTLSEGRFEDTNKLFERPEDDDNISFTITDFNSDQHAQLITNSLITFDWRKPTVQMLGRWQPFHDGHVALFERAVNKTGQVAIQVRDCQNWDDSNPFNFEDVRNGVVAKLSEHNYTEGVHYIVQLVPNITNITYGRGVGYAIEEEEFSKDITDISATKIRKELGYDK